MKITRDTRLFAQLIEMEKRWKWVHFIKSACFTFLILATVLIIGSVLDYFLALSMFQRLFLTFTCYTTVLSYIWFGWIRPYKSPFSPEKIAWILESAIPEFNEKLISAVEFSGRGNAHISMELINRVLEETEVDLSGVNPEGLFPVTKRYFITPMIIGIIFVMALSMPSLKFGRLVKRVAFPSSRDASVGRFDLFVVKPKSDLYQESEPIHFVARCTDMTIRDLTLCIKDNRLRSYAMCYDKQTDLFYYTLTNIRKSIDFWISYKNITSTKYKIKIVKRPKIEQFIITYNFPGYTKLSPSTVKSTSGDLKAYKNTKVDLIIKASKPLDTMTIEWQGKKKNILLDEENTEGSGTVTITENGSYSIYLRDTENITGLKNIVYSIVAIDDDNPSITLERPTVDLHLQPYDTVYLRWNAEDDFGIKHKELHYILNKNEEKIPTLDTEKSHYNWFLKNIGLISGDEIEYYIRVYDTSSHHADTQHKKIFISQRYQLLSAGKFLQTANNLREQLQFISDQIEIGYSLHNKNMFIHDRSGGSMESLEHNLNMIHQYSQRISRELKVAEQNSVNLKKYSFFSRSSICSDLMERYFRQNRLFPSDNYVSSLDKMAELTTLMTDALIKKSQQQMPFIQLQEIISSALLIKELKGEKNSLRYSGIARQAGKIASFFQSPLSHDFEGYSGKSLQGIRGEYYNGTNTYVIGKEREKRKPKVVKIDHKINFAKVDTFGVGAENMAASWSGLINIHTAGTYLFFLNSDDGSRMYIDGKLIVNNDGNHPIQERQGSINLTSGLHTIHIFYFNGSSVGAITAYWQPPGLAKVVIPENVLFVDHPDALHTRLLVLEKNVAPKINDFKQLDTVAELIRKQLKSLQDNLKNVAQNLELYNRKKDWEIIKNVAENIRTEAEAIKKETKKTDLIEIKKALDKAIKEKDISHIQKTSKILPAMERKHALLDLEDEISTVDTESDKILDKLKKNLKKKNIIDFTSNHERITENLRRLKETPLDGKALNKDNRTKPVYDNLSQAVKTMELLKKNLKKRENEEAIRNIDKIKQHIKTAKGQINAVTERSDKNYALALKSLKRLTDSDTEEFNQLYRAIRPLSGIVKSLDINDPEKMIATQHDIANMSANIRKMARQLEKDARKEITRPSGNIKKARIKLIASATLDTINKKNITTAREALEKAAKKTQLPRFFKRRARAKDDKRRNEKLSEAGRHMRTAINNVKKIEDLIEKSKAEEERGLSVNEQKKLDKTLNKVAEKVLTHNLINTLNMLENLRESRAVVNTLTKKVDKLYKRQDHNQATKLSLIAKEVKQNLEEVLTQEGHEAFLKHADNLLADTRRSINDLLDETRTLRILPVNSKSPAEMTDEIKKKESKLKEKLAESDSIKEILDGISEQLVPEKVSTLDLFKTQVEPHLSNSIKNILANKNAKTPVKFAVEGIKNVAKIIDKYTDAVAEAGKTKNKHMVQSAKQKITMPNMNNIHNHIDQMRNMLSEAKGKSDGAKEIYNKIHPHELKSILLLDQVPMEEITEKEKQRLIQIKKEHRIQSFYQKSLYMNEVAKMMDKIKPDLKKKMEETVKILQTDHTKADTMAQLERLVDQKGQQIIAKAQVVKNELPKELNPLTTSVEKTLDELVDNVNLGAFKLAEKNMEAIDKDILEMEKNRLKEEKNKRKIFKDNDIQYLTNTQREYKPFVMKIEKIIHTAPDMKKARNNNMDWNARRGLMEMVNDSLKTGYIDSEANKVATAVKKGEFKKAAVLARGLAGDEMSKAAELNTGKTPLKKALRIFEEPRHKLTSRRERNLAKKAEENKNNFIKDTLDKVKAIHKKVNSVKEKLAKKPSSQKLLIPEIIKLEKDLNETEAMRATLGAYEFGAYKLIKNLENSISPEAQDHKDKGKKGGTTQILDRLDNQLAEYQDELKKENKAIEDYHKLEKHVKDLKKTIASAIVAKKSVSASKNDIDRKKEKETLNKTISKALEKTKALEKMFTDKGMIPAEQGLKTLKKLNQKIKTGVFNKQEMEHLTHNLEQAVDTVKRTPLSVVPLNNEAFDSTAIANVLNNQDAINKALKGDYNAAAKSMSDFAKALPEGALKALANKASNGFIHAKDAQMENMPDNLANAVTQVEPEIGKLPPFMAKKVKRAVNDARAGDYKRSAENIHSAIAEVPADKKAILQNLEQQLKNTFTNKNKAINSLPEEIREELNKINKLKKNTHPVIRAELEKAEKDIKKKKYIKAANRMAAASISMQGQRDRRRALNIANNLAKTDKKIYGDAGDIARSAIDQLKKNTEENKDILNATKENDYINAAALARSKGENESAKIYDQAVKKQARVMPKLIKDGVKSIKNAINKVDNDAKKQLKEAESAAYRGDINTAKKITQKLADKRKKEVAITKLLEQADTYQKTEIQSFKKAIEAAKQNRFSHAAAYIAGTDHGEKLVELLSKAEKEIQKVARTAFKEAYKTDDNNAINQLVASGNRALVNDLKGAISYAKAAGKDGKNIVKSMKETDQFSNKVKKELEKTFEKVKKNNKAINKAEKHIKSALADFKQNIESGKKLQKAKTEEEQILRTAKTALDQNQFKRAAKLVEKIKDKKRLANRIRKIKQNLDAGAVTAKSIAAENNDLNIKNQLNEIARFAESGDINNAKNKALAVGKIGEKILKQFKISGEEKIQIQKALETAAVNAGNEARKAIAGINQTVARQTALNTAENQMKQKLFTSAAQTVRQSLKGRYEAGRAAEAFAFAEKSLNKNPKQIKTLPVLEPKQNKYENPALTAQENLSRALTDVNISKNDLASGNVKKWTAEKLRNAENNLLSASDRMSQSALADMASASAKQQEKNQHPVNADNISGSGGEGKKTILQRKQAEIPDDIANMMEESWDGVNAKLGSGDQKRRKILYSDYYRNANKQYFEMIHKNMPEIIEK